MKKLCSTFIVLFLIGVGLTFYLPAPSIKHQAAYTVDQTSLDTPINSKLLQLDVMPKSGQLFSLLLGTYSDLGIATNKAAQLNLNQHIYIITYEDNMRLWYALILGGYTSEKNARAVQKKLTIASSLVSQPINLDTKD